MSAQQRLKPPSKFAEFDQDYALFCANRAKYKGIRPRDENCSWCFILEGKQVGSRKRLDDIYQFKLDILQSKKV